MSSKKDVAVIGVYLIFLKEYLNSNLKGATWRVNEIGFWPKTIAHRPQPIASRLAPTEVSRCHRQQAGSHIGQGFGLW